MVEEFQNLKKRVIWRGIVFIIVFWALIFGGAGTVEYWEGWIYFFVFSLCSFGITFYLWKYNPELLRRRMQSWPTDEKSMTQKIIHFLIMIAFFGMIAFPPIDYRLELSNVPPFFVIVGDILVAVGYYIIFLVMKENSFAATTVNVESEQKVVDTGLYARVRHPMYSGALVMFFGTPLALGSWWGFLVFILSLPVLVWRLLDEEKFLSRHLQGYNAYCQKTRYRLVPHIW